MKFCWSTLYVKNMEESLMFYEEIVGLKVNKRFQAGPAMEIVFLGDGETQIELICNDNKKEVNAGKKPSSSRRIIGTGRRNEAEYGRNASHSRRSSEKGARIYQSY